MRMTLARGAFLLLVVALALVPLAAPQFWVTLGNYIGLYSIVALGLVQVPEGRRVFPELSVEENLRVGAYLVANRAKVRDMLADVYARFPRLAERRRQLAGTLSGGEQQMLAFGRAMMAQPKLLMLDEPSLGLAPRMVDEVMRSIRMFRESGVTIFLVEQNANLALRLADRAYVMETGQITMTGSGAQLLADARVRASYLGAKTTSETGVARGQ